MNLRRTIAFLPVWLVFLGLTRVVAVENMPQKPFAQMVWVPSPGQWVVTPWYEYTEFQDIWVGGKKQNITVGDGHGFDQNNGILMVEWGFQKDWAADLTIGATSLATKSFSNPPGSVQTTEGLMDVQFGVRWQLLNETNATYNWVPTLTLRVGGLFDGTYEGTFPYAPGNDSVGLETQVLLHKDFGWEGFGSYGNFGFRSIRSGGYSQWFGSIGLAQRFKGFTFYGGVADLQNTTGEDVVVNGNTITYSPKVKEISETWEAGASYTDRKGRIFQFYYAQNFAGRNTGDKQVYGVYYSMPFGGRKTETPEK